jgi:hypothetical protein
MQNLAIFLGNPKYMSSVGICSIRSAPNIMTIIFLLFDIYLLYNFNIDGCVTVLKSCSKYKHISRYFIISGGNHGPFKDK